MGSTSSGSCDGVLVEAHRYHMLLARIIDLYSLVVLGAVIVSWLRLPPDNPVAKLANVLTEPVLAPIRKVLPSTGGLDFSPMVLLVGLQLLKRILM